MNPDPAITLMISLAPNPTRRVDLIVCRNSRRPWIGGRRLTDLGSYLAYFAAAARLVAEWSLSGTLF